MWNGGTNDEENKLGEGILNAYLLMETVSYFIFEFSLTKADKLQVKSIAFPCLVGGLTKFPREQAMKIVVQNCVKLIKKYWKY